MRNILVISLLITLFASSQSHTEVYLFDISNKNNTLGLSNQRNISNNEGYDNQPSFYNDDIVLFSSTRDGQTDIAAYYIRDKKTNWITDTPDGSEYSPTKIHSQKRVSAIRLDKNGKQRLYTYDYKTRKSKVLLESLKVGYHTWFNKYIIVSSVLEDEAMSLIISNINDNTNYTFQKKVGRSLHKIPNSKLISYISKENDTWEIKSLDPISGATKKIINTIPKAEDMCWLINGTILMGKGDTIYKFNPSKDNDWSVFYIFDNPEMQQITLASNPNSSKLAVVSERSSKGNR